jgi:KipI family sensor histidine kinase inhibitor
MPDTSSALAGGPHSTRLLPCGDTALCIEFGKRIDRGVSARVLALAERLETATLPGVVELVPTFRSLMVHYDPAKVTQAELKEALAPHTAGLDDAEIAGRRWLIPACYDADVAPDLAEVAERTGFAPDEVVRRHSAVTYHVYMLGFLPGYPYLGDLPPELALPRRENPRTKVPAGSIAIATTMTAVYALECPGGWHLIGRTPVPLWDLRRDPPAVLRAGDKVMFRPISRDEYENLSARSASGAYRLDPEADARGPRT